MDHPSWVVLFFIKCDSSCTNDCFSGSSCTGSCNAISCINDCKRDCYSTCKSDCTNSNIPNCSNQCGSAPCGSLSTLDSYVINYGASCKYCTSSSACSMWCGVTPCVGGCTYIHF